MSVPLDNPADTAITPVAASGAAATGTGCPTPNAVSGETCAPGILVTQPLGTLPETPTPNRTAAAGPSGDTGTLPPATALPTPLPPTPFSPLSCSQALCIIDRALFLARPVLPPGLDTVDPTYRYGSTQGKARDPHHGVEFLNPHGTPVLAAMEGRVVTAGDDRTTFYGPYSYFYGNLVVIEHAASGLEEPLYTLYGHLSEIAVQVGQAVKTGQVVGKVGMSGVATGSHLHFEVRLGSNEYSASSNPELWLAPRMDESGAAMGALAGRVQDEQGNLLPVPSLVLERLEMPDGWAGREYYLNAYEEKALLGRPPWGETFAIGDLPTGRYRIHYIQSGMQEQEVEIYPGKLTVVTLRPRQEKN